MTEAKLREQMAWHSMTSESWCRMRLLIQSVSLQSAVHMGIVRNLSEEKKYQNLTTQQKPGRWESPASGTGWYNNVSSRSWSRLWSEIQRKQLWIPSKQVCWKRHRKSGVLIQNTRLHYVVELDVKGFFDNVDHSKLIKQIWSLGIRDKNLLFVLKRILKAPIRLENGAMEYPTKGTPQGGIISPLLANIVLNELDQWVDSQWQDNPVTAKYKTSINANGSINKSNAYKFMRRTNLKEMYIVRYADDFRIFCRTKDEAERTMKAVTQWLMNVCI